VYLKETTLEIFLLHFGTGENISKLTRRRFDGEKHLLHSQHAESDALGFIMMSKLMKSLKVTLNKMKIKLKQNQRRVRT
jgi:hypothetical protein